MVVLDKLTYAGNLGTIKDEIADSRVRFVKGDIRNAELVANIFAETDIDYVVNFAAESHVDRSIANPQLFLETNILGTQNMLDCARKAWYKGKDTEGKPLYAEGKKFLQVSTDEVYGALGFGDKPFNEGTRYDPHSPYSASKASSDHFVRAFHDTYGLPTVVTNCSNNYGPYQFPEKLIPLLVNNIRLERPLPVYGRGENVRDWLHVEDHARAIDLIFHEGQSGETYNIGGGNEWRNIDLIRSLYPQVENIALVTDNTYGGISLQALVRKEMEKFPELNLVLIDSRHEEDEIRQTMAALPRTTAVLLGTWRVGSDGQYLMQSSLQELVRLNPHLPVFSLTGTGIGTVAVGGYVPVYDNGAAQIARQIASSYFDGTGKAHIHLTDGEYRFDAKKLRESKIPEYNLPEGSVIEDTTAAKLVKYSHYIDILVALLAALAVLLGFVVLLYIRSRRLQRLLARREEELVVAKERAEESDMLKSAFLANMSHEIRTPLNAIVGFSSLMQSEELSQEERAEYCAIVVSNSEMLLTLLNDILDISSLECGKIRFNYASEDIVQICQHVMMTTAHTRQRGVEGRFACPVGSFMLTTDAHRLSQILINLLTNAGKFTSEGSITLGVEIDEERGEVLFSVADTGPGIPPDKQDLVFNRFEKLDGNKKKGTGLGLAICRQIAMIVGGRIWVDSAYTGGARFVFAHPIGIDPGGENREGGGISTL